MQQEPGWHVWVWVWADLDHGYGTVTAQSRRSHGPVTAQSQHLPRSEPTQARPRRRRRRSRRQECPLNVGACQCCGGGGPDPARVDRGSRHGVLDSRRSMSLDTRLLGSNVSAGVMSERPKLAGGLLCAYVRSHTPRAGQQNEDHGNHVVASPPTVVARCPR